ncbi:unnamed protein product [Oikopleura dioica]|uniref:G-protein coupled receptors family 1 profile domain-containing protein n=1 Tax=Oikopleura dioica TaxID=34765 RepID=E4X2N0_OIKDI|nr:unnamed protein product [Oikopleura dioica]
MMTFFFLLPVIFTALGAVVIALKSAQYKYHGPAGRLKARDERRMNALVIAIYVGFILCWIPHYCYELIREFGTDQGRGILGRFLRVFADMRYYFCAFGMAINPILLGLAGPGFWCRKKKESSQKEPLLGQKSDHL